MQGVGLEYPPLCAVTVYRILRSMIPVYLVFLVSVSVMQFPLVCAVARAEEVVEDAQERPHLPAIPFTKFSEPHMRVPNIYPSALPSWRPTP